MKNKSKDENIIKCSQLVLKNKMKIYKQRSLDTKSARTSKVARENTVINRKKLNDLKKQLQSNHVMKSSPEKLQSDNISLSPRNNLVTPSKINPEFNGTSHVRDFETVNMRHDIDDIINWEHINFPSDFQLDCASPEVLLRILDSELELQTDPLSIENKNKDRKSKKLMNQSSLEKSVNKSSQQKSNKKGRLPFAIKISKAEIKSKNFIKKSRSSDPFETKNSSSHDVNTDIDVDDILEEVYQVEQQEILSSQTIEKLQIMEVRLIHKVPAQHKIENNAGSRALTLRQKKAFERYTTMMTGHFSEEEDSIIKENWKSFCQIHKWDKRNVQPFLYMRHQGKYYISDIKERQKFVQFLANGLPCRTLYSVNCRFRNLFGKKFHKAKGRFSEKEDNKIKLYMKGATDSNKKFAQLAKILGRTRQSVWFRYQLLQKYSPPDCEKVEKKCITEVTWTVALIEEFIQQLMGATLCEDVKELKYAVIPKVVWKEMESRMHIDYKILKVFWLQQLHMQLFSSSPVYLNDIKIKLIECLYTSDISHPKEINWSDICTLFTGMTTAFLCRVFYGFMQHVSRKKISKNFSEIMEYLHNVMIPSLKNQPKDKFLPRILFKDETIRILDDVCEEEEGEEEVEEELPRRRSDRLKPSRENRIEHKDESDVTWSLPMREKFLKTLLAVTLCKHVEELKDAIIPKVVWEEVAERMMMDENKLIELWYKEMHMQLFSPITIYMNDVKVKLIVVIYELQIKELDLIKWPKVCKYFDGMTTFFISEVFFNLVRTAQYESDSNNFGDIMEYLHKTMILKLKHQRNDQFLPRISFKNKTLSVVVEEFQKKVPKQERSSNSSSSFNTSNAEFENPTHITWTVTMREKFIKKLLVVTFSTNIYDLKDAIIPQVVWDEMEKKMKMDQKHLKELWYNELHLQLFSSNQIFMNDIKIKLIRYFYRTNITEISQIFWPKVCRYFDGFTTFFLSKVFHELVCSASEDINSVQFTDILEYLYKKKIQSLIDQGTDVMLPRIVYERGYIRVINENIKEES